MNVNVGLDGGNRLAAGHDNSKPPSYEAIHDRQPGRGSGFDKLSPQPVFPVAHSNNLSSTGATGTSHYPISRPLRSKPSRPLKSVTPSAATCKQVEQTILKLIRALVLDASPSPKLLDSCADACQTYRVDFAAILQKQFINDHCAVYWAILKGHDESFIRSLLAYEPTPITHSIRSEIYHACLATSNQNLFHSLRCWRAALGNKAAPLSKSIYDTDKLVLGSMSADEVSVTEIPGQGAFVANMQINLWQKRMRIAGRVYVEFMGLGRIWRLAFCTPSRGVVGKWVALLYLLEHSPPTFINARLIIDPPPLSSNPSTSQTTDLISLSLPPDSNSPPAWDLTTQSVTDSKVERTIVLHFQSRYRLAFHSEHWGKKWEDVDGYTCTRKIAVPLDQGASAELSYDNTPFVASDGTLYARFEVRLGSARKPKSR